MAKKVGGLALVVVVVVAVLLAEAPNMAEAVTCDPSQLSSCAGSIFSSQQPTGACCAKLKEQKPCLCEYYRNPALSQYVNSPGAKHVLATCKVSVSC